MLPPCTWPPPRYVAHSIHAPQSSASGCASGSSAPLAASGTRPAVRLNRSCKPSQLGKTEQVDVATLQRHISRSSHISRRSCACVVIWCTKRGCAVVNRQCGQRHVRSELRQAQCDTRHDARTSRHRSRTARLVVIEHAPRPALTGLLVERPPASTTWASAPTPSTGAEPVAACVVAPKLLVHLKAPHCGPRLSARLLKQLPGKPLMHQNEVA